MPSEQHIATPAAFHDLVQSEGQVKTCSVCHTALSDHSTYLFVPEKDALVCLPCRHRSQHEVIPPCPEGELQDASHARHIAHEDSITSSTELNRNNVPVDSGALTSDTFLEPQNLVAQPVFNSNAFSPSSPPVYARKESLPPLDTRPAVREHVPKAQPHSTSIPFPNSSTLPDPFTDITRLRKRAQSHHCLYPGSIFKGEQKSGRTSYDVTVTICDVDFDSSFLCGYLCIRNLTDEFPELTTYFDAEIIGSRYGFLTPNCLAEEHEDLRHWARFPAFRHVKHELRQPRLTMADRDRGAVFMRWKERFLVPDHRVESISGASFAGFYYVCVDFNPPSQSSVRTTSQPMPQTPEDEEDESALATSPGSITQKEPTNQRGRRGSSVRRGETVGPRGGLSPPVATMTGFYHHKNSEPYQRLSLTHVPSRFTSSFEFR